MKDSLDLSAISPGLSDSSSLKHVCSNEISIRNQPYIISMSVHNVKQAQMDLEVEAKESADQWKASFDATAIETMTAKTGNFKSFSVFVNMLENAINQESTSVNIDLFTYDDLEALRKKRQGHSENLTHHQPTNVQLANKRYLILTYNAEYDRIYYPLSLPYCGKPDPVVLMQQIRQLTNENRLLKSRLESDVERSDIIRLQRECARLKKENADFRQQLSSNRSSSNSNEQQQQIDLLRQMVRASEDALTKERTKTTKTEDYRVLNDQVESLKSSERQLKSKVRSLTNEIALLKRSTLHHPTTVRSSSRERSLQLNGYSPRSSQQQQRPPSGGDQRRPRSDHLLPTLSSRNRSKHRSTSNDSRRSGSETRHRSTSITKRSPSPADSRGRFNPTAYIRERNLKLRQIELQKSREARRRRSAGRRGSDSDMSDFSVRGGSKAGSIASLRLNDSDDGLRTSGSRRSSSRKQSSGYKPKDSTDSDMEGVSSPAVLRKAASNNTTGFVPYKSQHQQNVDPTKVELANANDMVDIDERLKSLEKFMKENLPS